MRVNTIDEVKNIEREAETLERDYKDKLKQMEVETDERIKEMKEKVEADLAQFTQQQASKKEDKLEKLKASINDEQQKDIDQLETNFKAKEAELVNAVIEEVMRTYGNS